MGQVVFRTLVASGDEAEISALYSAALEIVSAVEAEFEIGGLARLIVSPVKTAMIGYATFFVAPAASKAGWTTGRAHAELIRRVVAQARHSGLSALLIVNEHYEGEGTDTTTYV